MKRRITLYLCLRRAWNWRNGNNVTLISTTTQPPTRRPSGSVVVKLRVELPDSAFDPAAIPSLIADIPLEAIQPAPAGLEVIIEDPA